MDYRILIAEDEPKLRQVLCDYFSSRGDCPIAAPDGIAALALAQEQEFDGVLLDIMMPGLDGFSLCRTLRRHSDVPIIFLTALSDEEDKLLGYQLGADDYVTKPFTMSVLYAKLCALINRVLQRLELAAKAKNLEVSFYLQERLFVTADETRIEQVVTNLLTNAIQYTGAGGWIRIKLFSYQSAAHFSVENSSQPIPPETLEKLWDSFYRADSARSSNGTGLGLAIVKNIIQLHRGSCRAKNTADGVEFRFSLPL